MTKPSFFILRPATKDYLWGGKRLKQEYGKDYIDCDPLAECWECSTHPDGVSMIANGEFAGKTLREVVNEYPQFLGIKYSETKELPIIVKLIDATKKLSVQVHPDDEYAAKNEGGSKGKTEMWYVLDTLPESEVIFGLQRNAGVEELRKGMASGTIEKYLNRINTEPGDIFYIKPGTIHAIGAGNVIAEIQESSNVTYRFYDYGRRDRYGNLRELHIDKAMEVIRPSDIDSIRQPMRFVRYHTGYSERLLCRCEIFEVRELKINYEGELVFAASEESFRVILCVEGEALLDKQIIKKGQCVFICAGETYTLSGSATFLDIHG